MINSIRNDCCINVYGFIHKSKLEIDDSKQVLEKEKVFKNFIDEKKMNFLTKCIQTEPASTSTGVSYLIQAAGMAGLEPNTILTSFPEGYREDKKKAKRFFDII